MEMTASFKELAELAHDDQKRAGGKGRALARLHRSGYNVPDGFIIFPEAWSDDELSSKASAEVAERVAMLREKIGSDSSFAVRSSAFGEDSRAASFAGGFDTVLDVKSDDEIAHAVRKVRASRRNSRALSYGREKNVSGFDRMAVVVQRCVRPEYAGVIFTADPIRGDTRVMTGNYVSGFGESLVSGEASGESFSVEKRGLKYKGPREIELHAIKLARAALRIEKEFGERQDIEWAVSDGSVYILQTRPITVLQSFDPDTFEQNDSRTGDYLWSNVNFGEAIPGVMTPFTASILKKGPMAKSIVFEGAAAYGEIGGRPYLNVSVFLSIYRALGKSPAEARALIEDALHFRLPENAALPLIPAGRGSLLRMLRTLLLLKMNQRRDLKRLPGLLESNVVWCEETLKRIGEIRLPGELHDLAKTEIWPRIEQFWPAMLSSATHHTEHASAIRKKLVALLGPEDADALISRMSSDNEMLESAGLVLCLSKVLVGSMTEAEYLARFGHRAEQEWEFSHPRFGEDPEWLKRRLEERRSLLDADALLPARERDYKRALEKLERLGKRRAKSLARAAGEIAPRARLRELARSECVRVFGVLRFWALKAGELLGIGEDIFYLSFDEALEGLAGSGISDGLIAPRKELRARYRSLPPLPSVIRGRFEPLHWAARENRRGDYYDACEADRENRGGDLYDAHGADREAASIGIAANEKRIFGAAGSPGRVLGVVRRLDDPGEGRFLQKGEILVTAQTNIAWTFLFPTAGAVVTDVGAPLSHAAIVAREFGVPAVVGCRDATARLKTGDRVRVDGGLGVVDLLD